MSVKIFDNEFVFIKEDKQSDLGELIWICRIVPNTVYDQFQKQPLWVADKRVEFDGIRLYSGYIDLIFKWYENIPGISGLYLFYRLYCDINPHFQSHTQLVHGNISTTQIYGIAERHNSARYKIPSP